MPDYIALLHKDAHSDYGVSFPDFPGCVTAGRTLEEARTLATEALGLHVEGMVEDGQALPDPSALDTVMAIRENRAAVAFLVALAEPPGPRVRVNITLSAADLAAIDQYAASHGQSRSGFLVAAARRALGKAA